MDQGSRIQQKIREIHAKNWRYRFLNLLTQTCKINNEKKSTTYDFVNKLLEMLSNLHSDCEKNPFLYPEDFLDFSLLEECDILKDQPEKKKWKISRLKDNIKCNLSILHKVKDLKAEIKGLKSDLEKKDQLNWTLQEEQKILKLNIEKGKNTVKNLNSKIENDTLKIGNIEHLLRLNKTNYDEALKLIASNKNQIKNLDDDLNDIKKRNQILINRNGDLIKQNQENNLVMEADVDRLQMCLDSEKKKNESSLKNITTYYKEIFDKINVSLENCNKSYAQLKFESDNLRAILLVKDQEKAVLQHMYQMEREQNLKKVQNAIYKIKIMLQKCEKQRAANILEISSLSVKLKNAEDLINAYKNAKEKNEQKLIKANSEFIAECKMKEKLYKGLECMRYEYKNLEVSLKVSKKEYANLLLEVEKEKHINKKQQEQFDIRYSLLQYKIGRYYENL